MIPRRHRHPMIVWVPVVTNTALVALDAALNDPTAVALTAISAVVVTGAIVAHLRESDLDNERIAYLQATTPSFSRALDADTIVNLVPKPSPVVGQVLRQLRPVVLPDVVNSSSIAAAVPIDRS